jgi:hypothetical protein
VANATRFDCLKPWFLPNRHSFFQLINDPLTRSETFAAMRTCYSQEKGWFSNCDKSNSVVNDNELEPKFLYGLLGNSRQLVLSHLAMRLILNSLDLMPILNWSDHAPEINNRAGSGDIAFRRREWRLCHRNFTNYICHAIKLLGKVVLLYLNHHKRRYQNEHESM